MYFIFSTRSVPQKGTQLHVFVRRGEGGNRPYYCGTLGSCWPHFRTLQFGVYRVSSTRVLMQHPFRSDPGFRFTKMVSGTVYIHEVTTWMKGSTVFGTFRRMGKGGLHISFLSKQIGNWLLIYSGHYYLLLCITTLGLYQGLGAHIYIKPERLFLFSTNI